MISLAFGVDARELWPATVSGATKGDAMIQHLKARGKGTGQVLSMIEQQVNWKYLPPSLNFRFDFQDDEQDALRADISDKRSQRNERDLATGSMTVRVDRERMLEDGDITRPQFEQMELDDGRLDDGTSVLSLFFSDDEDFKQLLSVGIENPFSMDGIDTGKIDTAIAEAHKWLIAQGWSTKKEKARKAIAALQYLKNEYESALEDEMAMQPLVEKPGRKPAQSAADAERRRNYEDYRGGSEMDVIERLK